MQDGLKWQLTGTGGGCTALVIEIGRLRLLATWDGVAVPRPGEPVRFCLMTDDPDEQVVGGEVEWGEFILRSAEEWFAEAATRAIEEAREGATWPTM